MMLLEYTSALCVAITKRLCSLVEQQLNSLSPSLVQTRSSKTPGLEIVMNSVMDGIVFGQSRETLPISGCDWIMCATRYDFIRLWLVHILACEPITAYFQERLRLIDSYPSVRTNHSLFSEKVTSDWFLS